MARPKGIPCSEEQKKKISERLKGKKPKNFEQFYSNRHIFPKGATPWNKGLTNEDPRIKKGSLQKAGVNHWNWKGGRTKDFSGHIWIARGEGNKVLEHQFVWCSQPENLSYIPRGFCIHHLNGIPDDNRPENLVLLDHKTHKQIHGRINYPKGSYLGRNNGRG